MAIPGSAVITGEVLKGKQPSLDANAHVDTQMVLPTDTVMYQAQEVAAVIAMTGTLRRVELKLLKLGYEPMKAVVDPFKAMEKDAPILRTEKGKGRLTIIFGTGKLVMQKKPNKFFKNADVVVEEKIYLPRIHVCSIETCGCVASFDPAEGEKLLSG
ncbi:MAG: hypothetical protein Ct9H300mP28_00790 [Pseudomonadota bacterium]|nr:MAG: hypothetical protein Ct9H300mP28_00790 [Pseudomonadota bacterium]